MATYLTETCRGCLSTQRASMMYSLYEEETRKLFSTCSGLNIADDDGEPLGQLCAECYEFCEKWYEFKMTCWRNDKRKNDLEIVELDDESDAELDVNGLDETESEGEYDPRYDEQVDYQESDGPAAVAPESSLAFAHSKQDWKCIYCKKHHDSYIELRLHLVDQHINPKSPVCGLCEIPFTNVPKLTYHIILTHMKKLDCPHCPKRLTSFARFDKHMEEVHLERGYGYLGAGGDAEVDEDWNCPACPEKFTQYVTLRIHLKRIHLSKSKCICPVCNLNMSESKMINHIVGVHMKKYECRLCHKKFPYMSAWKEHPLKCPMNGNGPIPGTTTKKRALVSNLSDDEDSDNDDDVYKPRIKMAKTESTIPLQKNMCRPRRISNYLKVEVPNGNWDCLVCKEPFTTYNDLRLHLIKVHLKRKAPNCPVCNKKCSMRKYAVRCMVCYHMRKFDCHLCPARLHSFAHFNEHVNVIHNIAGYDLKNPGRYSESAPAKSRTTTTTVDVSLLNWDKWDCPVCATIYTEYRKLRRHMYTKHLEATDSSCPICGDQFPNNSVSYQHVVKIHMRKLDCPYCPKKFEVMAVFKDHLKNTHNLRL